MDGDILLTSNFQQNEQAVKFRIDALSIQANNIKVSWTTHLNREIIDCIILRWDHQGHFLIRFVAWIYYAI